ncbi:MULTISPECIES: hypoxanthine-guanine phosphoribosyltransferase [unclassified Salinisphaera]|uniref:hypoxanthine-guanine phosphoribosyltransferase n=1 Tax=unclassified Salinisphaera TaxID=2649847 RepID=UPI000C617DC7|nr:hypoxanthine-guanine phosphoribosyltransferase [Salinisphaera sp.]MBS62771.1 hypoxanthine-guanine phosphoribosyltransferase [Salinisphaera sp.]
MSGFDSERYDEARAVRANADCLIDAAELDACYDRMAEQITAQLADKAPIMMCVMFGGMHPTAEITKRLDFAFELDYLHATRYRGETSGGELVWKVSPGLRLDGRHVCIIDDILDEGHTLEAIINAIEAQGAASVTTAMLLRKNHDRCTPGVHADIVGAEIEDRYVFGAGMDYKGYFRQLPAVYAVEGDTHPKHGG